MTREEKINTLKSIIQECEEYQWQRKEALFEIIKDLEQEPTTKNDLGVDCVSRQAVLDLIADNDLSMGQVVRGIHALPSVIPQEPKAGKWISTETKGVRYAFWCRYKCSLCGELSDHTNFCPNCGAKMVEPQESEDNND